MNTSDYNRWRYFGKENDILDEAANKKALDKAREKAANKEQQQKETNK